MRQTGLIRNNVLIVTDCFFYVARGLCLHPVLIEMVCLILKSLLFLFPSFFFLKPWDSFPAELVQLRCSLDIAHCAMILIMIEKIEFMDQRVQFIIFESWESQSSHAHRVNITDIQSNPCASKFIYKKFRIKTCIVCYNRQPADKSPNLMNHFCKMRRSQKFFIADPR